MGDQGETYDADFEAEPGETLEGHFVDPHELDKPIDGSQYDDEYLGEDSYADEYDGYEQPSDEEEPIYIRAMHGDPDAEQESIDLENSQDGDSQEDNHIAMIECLEMLERECRQFII